MQKNTVKLYIIPLLLCVMLLTQSSSHAQNAETEAEIQFIPGTGPTYPVDPESPETEENGTGVEGSLAIVSVSNFDFGAMPIETSTSFFDTTTIMPNIQVVDLRGTAAGWKVSASVSRFSSDGTNMTLPGAAIHIINGRPNSLSTSTAPEQVPNTVLTSDGESIPVINAAKGSGTGQWIMRWYPDENDEEHSSYLRLEIPVGQATIGNHNATIDWTLAIVP